MFDFFPKTTVREVLRKFLIYFPVGLLAVLVVFSMIARLEYQKVALLVANQDRIHLRQVQFVIGHDLEMLASDLMNLAGSGSLLDYLESPSEPRRNTLNNHLRLFAEDDKKYDQVRFLDGNVLVAEKATEKNPQNTQDMYSVPATMSLDKGDILVSLLDFNSDRAEIEINPRMCVATPVLDGSGQKRGMILITYRARHLLAGLSRVFPERDENRSAVAGIDGSWLKTDRSAQKLTLASERPELSYIWVLRQYAHLFWVFPLGLVALAAGTFHISVIRAKKERSDRAVNLLSTAIEQSPSAAVITDVDGRIQYANPKFLAMSGYERAEILGENPRVFQSGETPPQVYKDLWQTILGGEVWSGEFLNRRKDNSHYVVSAKISPILQKPGVISGFLAIQEDITETRRLQRQLEHLATTDGLTGSYNRSHFLNLFGQELRRADRYSQPFCLLVFDLDHFKSVNDNYGHQAGDQVLAAFAGIISSALRDSDLFGRLGGEEFGVVLVQTDHDGASLLAERLRIAIEKMRVTCGGTAIQVTVSIGGTQWQSSDRQIEPVLNRADNALYEAKRHGRNRVCFSFATDSTVRN